MLGHYSATLWKSKSMIQNVILFSEIWKFNSMYLHTYEILKCIKYVKNFYFWKMLCDKKIFKLKLEQQQRVSRAPEEGSRMFASSTSL